MTQKENYEAAMKRLQGQLDDMKEKDGIIENYVLLCESPDGVNLKTIMAGARGGAIVRLLRGFATEGRSLKYLAALAFVSAIDSDDEFRAMVMMLVENQGRMRELKEKNGLS